MFILTFQYVVDPAATVVVSVDATVGRVSKTKVNRINPFLLIN